MSGETERRDWARPVELVRAESGRAVARGYAYVFGALSLDLGGFRERIETGAGAESLSGGTDIVATFNHDARALLGRTAAATLRVGEDEVGGWYEIDLPRTSIGADVAELIERRDVRGSSFTFRATDTAWEEPAEPGGLPVRVIRQMEVVELGPVTLPAYLDTSVALRSLEAARRERVSVSVAWDPTRFAASALVRARMK
ncbi:hypothetical protein GCM10012275_19310 [Longimycelium tulufanense]|uniref:Prohead serine protease domain-containing protein n=1 Tax=Longimycelium tulufanense TaxID=907463 RepID=A0A8J3FV30_9PSEU|nr:HK97 family phage prohead protease [Longimycelium tulufanense]GGM48499.1 hypothetical protein GCM10012275_19310 [Longimycelium tulufanense]